MQQNKEAAAHKGENIGAAHLKIAMAFLTDLANSETVSELSETNIFSTLDSFWCCCDSILRTFEDCFCPTSPSLHNQDVRCVLASCAVSWVHSDTLGTNLPSSMALFRLHCLVLARLDDRKQPC